MIAYDETYLHDAMQNFGEAMDYAVNLCKLTPDRFFRLFISTGIARLFASASPKYICGMSGTELALEVLSLAGIPPAHPTSWTAYDRSPEFWCGWVLAFFQWHTGRSFDSIAEVLSMQEILSLYPPLHEASEEKFVEVANNLIRQKKLPSRLQMRRKAAGLSQRELSIKSEVNLRTIQQYELRTKHIGKAAAGTLLRLSRALDCSIEDLLEYDT